MFQGIERIKLTDHRTNYVHHFVNGMNNAKIPALTSEPERAMPFDTEKEANDILAKLSPGFQDRKFVVEPTPVSLSCKPTRNVSTLVK